MGAAAEIMSDEQQSDYAALAAAANEPNAGQEQAAALAEQQTASAADTLAGELAGMIGMVVGALAPALPSLPGIYTEQATGAAASAIAAVCVKHGWLGSGLFGRWGEELAAAAIIVPLGLATYAGVQGDIAAARAKSQLGDEHKPVGKNPERATNDENLLMGGPRANS